MLKWCGHWFASLTLWLSGWFPMLRAPRNCQRGGENEEKSVLQCIQRTKNTNIANSRQKRQTPKIPGFNDAVYICCSAGFWQKFLASSRVSRVASETRSP